MGRKWQKFRGTSSANQFYFVLYLLLLTVFVSLGVLHTGLEAVVSLLAAIVVLFHIDQSFQKGQRRWESAVLRYISEEAGLYESEEFRNWLMERGKYRWADQLLDIDDGGESQ